MQMAGLEMKVLELEAQLKEAKAATVT